MMFSDAEVIDRIRDTLTLWADEDPIGEPTLRAGRAGDASYGVDTDEVVELSSVETPGNQRATWWLVSAAAAAVAVIALVVTWNRPDEPVSPSATNPPTASGMVEIPVGSSSGVRGLAVTDDAVWVTSQFDETLYRVDLITNTVIDTFEIPEHVEGVIEAAGQLWLSRYEPNELLRFDPETGEVTATVAFGSQPNPVTDGERLWVVAADDDGAGSSVVEINPVTTDVIDEISFASAPGFSTLDGDTIWVAGYATTTVTGIDLATRTTRSFEVDGEARGVVVAGDSLWVSVNQPAPADDGAVVRVDRSTPAVAGTAPIGGYVHSIAADGDRLWATGFNDGMLTLIETTPTAHKQFSVFIGDRPGGVAIGDGSVWVTPHRRNVLLRIDPALLPGSFAPVPDESTVTE